MSPKRGFDTKTVGLADSCKFTRTLLTSALMMEALRFSETSHTAKILHGVSTQKLVYITDGSRNLHVACL